MARRRLFPVVVWLALAGGIGCDETDDVALPPELLGRWTTKTPKYADRYFELRSDRTAVFGLGGRRRDVSPIVQVAFDRDGDFLIYRISHLSDSGEVYILSLSYNPRRPGELRLVNQPGVLWTKQRDDPQS